MLSGVGICDGCDGVTVPPKRWGLRVMDRRAVVGAIVTIVTTVTIKRRPGCRIALGRGGIVTQPARALRALRLLGSTASIDPD